MGAFYANKDGTRTKVSRDPENLDNVKLKPADAAVLSPPYANRYEERSGTWPNGDPRDSHSYGADRNPAQVGGSRNRGTYLEEMLKVYASIFAVLKPGGVMALVTKDFVRDHARVPLGRYTVQLCERVGFRFQACPEGCDMSGHPHTHKCPLINASFWVRNASMKWMQKHFEPYWRWYLGHPSASETERKESWEAMQHQHPEEYAAVLQRNPYPMHEDILVFVKP